MLLEYITFHCIYLFTGNKETAFIYAITSAGVVYAVTRSCSLGNLTECGCATPRGQPSDDVMDDDEEWKWGGCTDDVDYGIKLARKFVDSGDKYSSSSSSSSPSPPPSAMSRPLTIKPGVQEMNLHNNEAGRQVRAKHQLHSLCSNFCLSKVNYYFDQLTTNSDSSSSHDYDYKVNSIDKPKSKCKFEVMICNCRYLCLLKK